MSKLQSVIMLNNFIQSSLITVFGDYDAVFFILIILYAGKYFLVNLLTHNQCLSLYNLQFHIELFLSVVHPNLRHVDTLYQNNRMRLN